MRLHRFYFKVVYVISTVLSFAVVYWISCALDLRIYRIYNMGRSDNEIQEEDFGTFNDDQTKINEQVKKFTLSNKNHMSVEIINYGATIISIKMPDKNGKINDIVLGYDDMKGYVSSTNPYFGAIVGRVANRIANGQFRIGDNEYNVTKNRGTFLLHGGLRGFDKVIWKPCVEDNVLKLSYTSKDGEEGFPGEVDVNVTYELTADNELNMYIEATTSKPTPINVVNHSYFNLAGHESGSAGLYNQLVTVNADKYTAVNADNIPTGELKSVEGTPLDLRQPTCLGDVINEVPGGGYDCNFCIHRKEDSDLIFVARLEDPISGRIMKVFSNQPGVQLYTSNYFPEKSERDESKLIIGKDGVRYYKHGGVCFETQNYPDAVNHANFPDSILIPGSTYYHEVKYSFAW